MSSLWTIGQLENIVSVALERSGASADTAQSVARALVRAEIDGQSGHGLRRVESYCAQLRSGKIDGRAKPKLTVAAAASARVNAASGFAFPALEMAADWLVQATPLTGIAAAGVNHSHHCGVAGHWVEALADRGLVGLMFANTPAAIPPAGGIRPLFGTNPIAMAAPRASGPALVIDLSLSQVARGKIMAARQKGEQIPPGWAIGPDGRDTADPAQALAGAMLPMGGPKGAVLAMMVELLAGGLVGANRPGEASSFLDAEGPPPGTGQLLITFSPAAFGAGNLGEWIGALEMAVTSQQGARMPGSKRHERRVEALREGVPVDTALVQLIGKL